MASVAIAIYFFEKNDLFFLILTVYLGKGIWFRFHLEDFSDVFAFCPA